MCSADRSLARGLTWICHVGTNCLVHAPCEADSKAKCKQSVRKCDLCGKGITYLTLEVRRKVSFRDVDQCE
eukprot:4128950-Amphidinium_carterae.1